MTVEQLIEELKKLPPYLHVLMESLGGPKFDEDDGTYIDDAPDGITGIGNIDRDRDVVIIYTDGEFRDD